MIRSLHRVALVAALAAAAACDDEEKPERYQASLSGQQEVPVRNTPASGTTELQVNKDNSISFTLDVTGLSNFFAAHIHGPAPAGVNAGVIVNLSTTPRMGAFTGRVAEGTLTATNNPAQVSMDSLLVLIRNGQAYVNVHTNDNIAGANTGPGDFAAGEIRGQLLRVP